LKNYVPELTVPLNIIKLIMVDFFDKEFLAACNNLNQTIEFCEVGAHHQNGIIKNRNKQLTQTARVLLLHGMKMWPQMVDQMF
jgi:hypothetical protein